MKVAVVYNRSSRKVINEFGARNLEVYGKAAITRIVHCLRSGGHRVASFEGDKDLIDRLEEFMPRVVAGERPGMVFNLAYGIQGQARYTHVPSILEMVGLPYVGSGPVAHSLSLDKVIAKMLFVQHGLATPEFAVLESPETPLPDLAFPLIVKPRNESVSFGLEVVHSADELREAAQVIFEKFRQPVLVERYIDGREINVGILGNEPGEALPPAELDFGDGPRVYTEEDKKHVSGREVGVVCPAALDDEQVERAQKLALGAYRVLGCSDCARVDMRLDGEGNFWILEINSLPSLGMHGSYVQGAEAVGLDFCGLVNRLVDVASARYFGTETPEQLVPEGEGSELGVFAFVTSHRERIERRIRDWSRRPSRTSDPVGIRSGLQELDRTMAGLGLSKVDDLSDEPEAVTWSTRSGIDGGTLLIAHLDVPLPFDAPATAFQRDPESLAGEGVGCSRAPLVTAEYALRALRKVRALRDARIGFLCYTDEGRDAIDSAGQIRAACERAARVIVLHPASREGRVVTQRRGLRRYSLSARGPVRRLGHASKRPELLRWLWSKLEACCELSDRKARLAVGVGTLKVEAYRHLLPHEVRAELMVGSMNAEAADELETRLRELLCTGREGVRVQLDLVSDRPPMADRRTNRSLFSRFLKIATETGTELAEDSSLLPSVAGLVPEGTPVLCGLAPAASDLYTVQESVQRLSVIQRAILLARLLHSFATESLEPAEPD